MKKSRNHKELETVLSTGTRRELILMMGLSSCLSQTPIFLLID